MAEPTNPTQLYNALSALHKTDDLLWGKTRGLSGQISSAFAANKVAVGSGTGLSASAYSISDTAASTLFTTENITLGTTIANANAIKSYVDGSIAAQNAQQGTALTGVAITGDALTVAINDKRADFTLKTDDVTIGQDANGLKSLIHLSGVDTEAGYAASYQLVDASGNALGDTINIPKDQFLSGASYDSANEKIVLTFAVAQYDAQGQATGETIAKTVEINAHDLVHELSGSAAITVTDVKDGQSEISLKLDTSTAGHETGDGKFLSITSNGLLLSGVQDAIDAASNDATAGLKALSAALTGYLGENAVSSEFTAVDNRLDALEGLTGAIADGHVVVGVDNTGKYADSGKTIGSSAFAATPNADTLATELGVSGYVAQQIQSSVNPKAVTTPTAETVLSSTNVIVGGGDKNVTASTFKIGAAEKTDFGAADELAVEAAVTGYVADQVAGAVGGVTTSGEFVFGKGNGAVETTGKTLLTSASVVDTAADSTYMTDSVIPTAAAVKAFVELGLENLYSQITGLNQRITNGQE